MTDVEMEHPQPKRPRPWEAFAMDEIEWFALTEWERNQLEGLTAAKWAEIGHGWRALGLAILRTRPLALPVLAGLLAALVVLLLLDA
jgi:hypothetical protein